MRFREYIIGVLLVGSLFLSSIIYKKSKEPVLRNFPIKKVIKKQDSDTPYFYIYIFYSKRNCYNCLRVIDVLNDLPEYFIVRGVVPEGELKDEKELREVTGAEFELEPISKKYNRFLPLYSPTIYGIDSQGIVYFILPGVPAEKEYLKKFIMTFYYKAYDILKDCGGACGKGS